jgi:hypothetical protein
MGPSRQRSLVRSPPAVELACRPPPLLVKGRPIMNSIDHHTQQQQQRQRQFYLPQRHLFRASDSPPRLSPAVLSHPRRPSSAHGHPVGNLRDDTFRRQYPASPHRPSSVHNNYTSGATMNGRVSSSESSSEEEEESADELGDKKFLLMNETAPEIPKSNRSHSDLRPHYTSHPFLLPTPPLLSKATTDESSSPAEESPPPRKKSKPSLENCTNNSTSVKRQVIRKCTNNHNILNSLYVVSFS